MDYLRVLLWALFSVAFAGSLAAHGLKRKSLSSSGAVAALVVGGVNMLYGFRYGSTLVAFYLSSSKLTKYKAEVKKAIEEDYKEGGQRDWTQVLANSLMGTCAAMGLWLRVGWRDPCFDSRADPIATALLGAFLGHFACCNGDTWASEVGTLSRRLPRLITTFKEVPKGTNGGVSLLGTAASAAGGAFIGLYFLLSSLPTTNSCHVEGPHNSMAVLLAQWKAVPLGLTAGFFGSMVDSLLGATLQYSGYCTVRKKVVSHPGPSVQHIAGVGLFTNGMVNFVTSAITALATAGLAVLIF